jgi:hypothetical protein
MHRMTAAAFPHGLLRNKIIYYIYRRVQMAANFWVFTYRCLRSRQPLQLVHVSTLRGTHDREDLVQLLICKKVNCDSIAKAKPLDGIGQVPRFDINWSALEHACVFGD